MRRHQTVGWLKGLRITRMEFPAGGVKLLACRRSGGPPSPLSPRKPGGGLPRPGMVTWQGGTQRAPMRLRHMPGMPVGRWQRRHWKPSVHRLSWWRMPRWWMAPTRWPGMRRWKPKPEMRRLRPPPPHPRHRRHGGGDDGAPRPGWWRPSGPGLPFGWPCHCHPGSGRRMQSRKLHRWTRRLWRPVNCRPAAGPAWTEDQRQESGTGCLSQTGWRPLRACPERLWL